MEFCSYCKTKIENDNPNCRNCGIPLYASEEEKSKYITNIHRTNEKYNESLQALNKAKWILFIIGLVNLFIHFYLFYTHQIGLPDIVFLGTLSGLLVIAGFLTNDYPIPSVLAGIIFVISIYVYQFYIDLGGIFRGIVWKFLILSSLVYALKTAIEFEKMIKD